MGFLSIRSPEHGSHSKHGPEMTDRRHAIRNPDIPRVSVHGLNANEIELTAGRWMMALSEASKPQRPAALTSDPPDVLDPCRILLPQLACEGA